MTDHTDLIAQLRKVRRVLETCRPIWQDQYEFLTEKAADALEAQGREIERLRADFVASCSLHKHAGLTECEARLAEAEREMEGAKASASDSWHRLAEAEALLREAREVLAEEWVSCCCHEAYTSRSMIDPNCRFHEQDTLREAHDRIDAFLGRKEP